LNLHLAAQAAAESDDEETNLQSNDINDEDDEGYAEDAARYDSALTRMIAEQYAKQVAEQEAAGYDDEEMYRQYYMRHKPTISPSILNSSLPEDKMLELVNTAENLANTHRLYGFYQDDSEDTQRKMNLNYVRIKGKRHKVSYVPGQECSMQCAFCWRKVRLHLVESKGISRLQLSNFYDHCKRRHYTRNAVGQEVRRAFLFIAC